MKDTEYLENKKYGSNQIVSQLETVWMGKNLLFFDEIDSTNVRAQLVAEQGAVDGTLIVADMQTAGRGRRGRSWESPAGTNVYFTLLLKPTFAPGMASKLTLLMAYAVKCAIEKYVPCAIKWPNDIVVDGKKVCGILTELRLEGTAIHHVAIGVGINVGRQDFPAELADKASCLADVCSDRAGDKAGDVSEFSGRPSNKTCGAPEISDRAGDKTCGVPEISRSGLIADILKVFEREYEIFAETCETRKLADFLERYNACLVNKDREVCVLDPKGEYRGIARGINEEGELLVELEDGTVREVYAGEVSVRGIYGYV